MPKAEKGSVKDIAKKIKSKGLQKLKFYCQMCEKQCRDANGFKCHIQSESHLRQMKLFSENASGIMDQYSKEFEKVYLDTLRMLHGTATVNANNVYQQVIRDKQHIHMNSTIWATLSDFCQYLGKKGLCKVEENERGWYITYINRDVELIARKQKAEQRLKAEQEAEVELAKQMEERRLEAALALDRAGFQKQEATKLEPRKENDAIQIALTNTTKPQSSTAKSKKKKSQNVFETTSDGEDEQDEQTQSAPLVSVPPPPPLSKTTSKRPVEEHSNSQDDKRAAKHRKVDLPSHVWLYRDIIVRIIDQKYKKGRYFRRKAYVDRVIVEEDERVFAELTLAPEKGDNDEEIILTLPQESLETVVPKQIDSKVRILKGDYRGKKANVVFLNKKEYQAQVELSSGKSLQLDFEAFASIA